jgi:hypothetical protein
MTAETNHDKLLQSRRAPLGAISPVPSINAVCSHTLAVGQVTLEDSPERMKKGLAKHPIPIMLLARLAIERRWQGRGVQTNAAAMLSRVCSVILTDERFIHFQVRQGSDRMRGRGTVKRMA